MAGLRPPYSGLRYCSGAAFVNDHSETVLCLRSVKDILGKCQSQTISYTTIHFTFCDAFAFRIAQECAEATRIQMIQYRDEKVLVELKRIGKLLAHLPHTIDKLQEYRRTIRVRMMIVTVSDALKFTHTKTKLKLIFGPETICFLSCLYLLEFMPETQPLLFHQHLKTAYSPIVRIQQQHRQRRQL